MFSKKSYWSSDANHYGLSLYDVWRNILKLEKNIMTVKRIVSST